MSSTMPPSDDTPPEDTTHDLSTLRGAMDDIIERAFNTVFTGTGRLYVAGHDSAFTGQVADLETPTAAEDTTPVPAAAVPPPADAATGKHKPRFRLRRKMPDSPAPAPEPEPSDEPTTVETVILPLAGTVSAASHGQDLYDMYLNVQPRVPGIAQRFYEQFYGQPTASVADPLQYTEGYNRDWNQILHQRMVRLDRNRHGGATAEDYTSLFERLWREHPLAAHAMRHPHDIMHVCGTSYDTLPIVAVVIRQADLIRRQETFYTLAVCPGRSPASRRVVVTNELLADAPETVYGMVRQAASAVLGEIVQSILHAQWPDNAS